MSDAAMQPVGDAAIRVGHSERERCVVVMWPVSGDYDARLRMPPSDARLLATMLVQAADALDGGGDA